jgi:hypothetical protein
VQRELHRDVIRQTEKQSQHSQYPFDESKAESSLSEQKDYSSLID